MRVREWPFIGGPQDGERFCANLRRPPDKIEVPAFKDIPADIPQSMGELEASDVVFHVYVYSERENAYMYQGEKEAA